MKIHKRSKNRAKVKSVMQTGRGFMDATEGFFREDYFLDSFYDNGKLFVSQGGVFKIIWTRVVSLLKTNISKLSELIDDHRIGRCFLL